MGLNITLDNINIGGDAKMINNAHISEDADSNIVVSNLNVKGNASILNDLNIEEIKEQLNQKIETMDESTREYTEIKKLLKEYGKGKEKFGKKLLMHLESFAEGVVASVVANYIGTI